MAKKKVAYGIFYVPAKIQRRIHKMTDSQLRREYDRLLDGKYQRKCFARLTCVQRQMAIRFYMQKIPRSRK